MYKKIRRTKPVGIDDGYITTSDIVTYKIELENDGCDKGQNRPEPSAIVCPMAHAIRDNENRREMTRMRKKEETAFLSNLPTNRLTC